MLNQPNEQLIKDLINPHLRLSELNDLFKKADYHDLLYLANHFDSSLDVLERIIIHPALDSQVLYWVACHRNVNRDLLCIISKNNKANLTIFETLLKHPLCNKDILFSLAKNPKLNTDTIDGILLHPKIHAKVLYAIVKFNNNSEEILKRIINHRVVDGQVLVEMVDNVRLNLSLIEEILKSDLLNNPHITICRYQEKAVILGEVIRKVKGMIDNDLIEKTQEEKVKLQEIIEKAIDLCSQQDYAHLRVKLLVLIISDAPCDLIVDVLSGYKIAQLRNYREFDTLLKKYKEKNIELDGLIKALYPIEEVDAKPDSFVKKIPTDVRSKILSFCNGGDYKLGFIRSQASQDDYFNELFSVETIHQRVEKVHQIARNFR